MRLLLSSNAQIHGVHGTRPAICWAADAGQLAAVVLLLAGGAKAAKVNDRCPFGYTALLDAAKGGHLPIVVALLLVRWQQGNLWARSPPSSLTTPRTYTPPPHSRARAPPPGWRGRECADQDWHHCAHVCS